MSLRPIEEQLAIVLDSARPLDSITLPLSEAAGMTAAEAVVARVPVPVFDNSAMDGFAVRYNDVRDARDDRPSALRVAADVPAGSAEDPPIAAGQAARIMTGAPVPSAADTIVPFEDTAGGLEDSLGAIRVVRPPRRPGAHIRRRGDDLDVGDVVVPAGTLLGPLQLAAVAAAGAGDVAVSRRPRVAVLSTGSELTAAGTPLGRGQIPESNSTLLAGLCRRAGAEVIRVGTVTDEEDAFRAELEHLSDADVIITSGGVSAGAYEVVKNVLAGDIEFAKVAMQPGKPQAFGRLAHGALLFGLPGNPVSAAVSFEVFVRPALLAMQRRTDRDRPRLRMPAAEGWRSPQGRRQYLPAALDRSDPARWTVRPATAGGSGSHLAGGLARAEAYAVVAAETDRIETGDDVEVMLLD